MQQYNISLMVFYIIVVLLVIIVIKKRSIWIFILSILFCLFIGSFIFFIKRYMHPGLANSITESIERGTFVDTLKVINTAPEVLTIKEAWIDNRYYFKENTLGFLHGAVNEEIKFVHFSVDTSIHLPEDKMNRFLYLRIYIDNRNVNHNSYNNLDVYYKWIKNPPAPDTLTFDVSADYGYEDNNPYRRVDDLCDIILINTKQ